MPEPDLLAQAMPPIQAAVAAYGLAVFTRAEDSAAAATVRLGQRLLRRITGRPGRGGGVESAVRDLAEAGPDEAEDATAALRFELRRLLKADPRLRDELAALLPAGPGATASGAGSVAVGGDVTGVVAVGDGSVITQHYGRRAD